MSEEHIQLRRACENYELDEVKQLIEEGVDVDSRDEFGGTPLMYACAVRKSEFGIDNVDIVRLLLDHGADVNHKFTNNDGGNGTALHYATHNGYNETVKLLIERGANLHVKDSGNRTPLDDAKIWKRSSTAATIIEAAMKSTKGKND